MKSNAFNTDEKKVNDNLIDENKSEDMNNEFMRMADDEFKGYHTSRATMKVGRYGRGSVILNQRFGNEQTKALLSPYVPNHNLRQSVYQSSIQSLKAKIGEDGADSDEDQIDRGDDHHLNASIDEDEHIVVEYQEEGTRNSENRD